MNIAIDVSPLQTGHKIRGVGFYLTYLKRSLLSYFPKNKYNFFTKTSEIPSNTDIVHYPYFDPFFLTLPLVKKHKTIVTVHDLTPIKFHKYFPVGVKGTIRWQIQKMNLRKVDAIITDSQSSKDDIVEIIGVPEDKVFISYLAAGEEFKKLDKTSSVKKVIRSKYNLPEKFILYVGDVTWNKNLPNLLQAVKKTGLPIVLVGKSLVQTDFDRENPWNSDLVKVQDMIRSNDKVITLGFVPTEDLTILYNIATVFIMPSYYEGFGLPVIEAMQSGCAVITTKEGSLPEVGGDACYYVDSHSIESIASGIKKVFDNPALQKELSRKGLERAKEFKWEKTAEQTVLVYQKVMQRK